MHGGGAIYNEGGITVDGCNFIGNTIETSGAAIMISTILKPASVVIIMSSESSCEVSDATVLPHSWQNLEPSFR